MMLNLQDTKQDSMMIEIKTMLEDTKRVDTLKVEDSKLMDRYDAREYKHSRPWSDSALFYRDYPRI